MLSPTVRHGSASYFKAAMLSRCDAASIGPAKCRPFRVLSK